MQEERDVYATEMDRCWRHFNTFQTLKHQNPQDPLWLDNQELIDSQIAMSKDEYVKQNTKHDNCTAAIREKKTEITYWKGYRDFEITREKRLRDIRRNAKEELKSLLYTFPCTDVITISTLDDLAAVRYIMRMRLPLPLRISLGPGVMNIIHLANETGLHGIRFGSIYQWDGSAWQQQ